MASAEIYWQKAYQSAQMAENASGVEMRNIYRAQEKAWRDIAERLELLAIHIERQPERPQNKIGGIHSSLRLLRSVFNRFAGPLN